MCCNYNLQFKYSRNKNNAYLFRIQNVRTFNKIYKSFSHVPEHSEKK